MFIRELYINDFRLFHHITIKPGRYLTAITGFNATGKSTILGLLGHCGELKKHKPLLQKAFRAELSDILKFSEKYDSRIPDLATLRFDDLPTTLLNSFPSELQYRSTLQQYQGETKRYRIIPKRTQQWQTSSKISWPTLYLGLGRLYPLGESIQVAEERLKGKITEEDKEYVLKNLTYILSMQDMPKDFTAASISETTKKKAIGVNTGTYDYLSNSAGQDNLGQILMSLLSFRKLKESLGGTWCGGLLVVDEIDAALHPLAQNKLVDFMYEQAEDIGIQVVFTTHSLGLLDHVSRKTEHNDPSKANNWELVCLSNANGPVEVLPNPSFDLIYRQLMATYSPVTARKISVFTEDEQARFFVGKLLRRWQERMTLLDVGFGCSELLRVLASDYTNFSHYLFILDGDVEDNVVAACAKRIAPLKLDCVIRLPGKNGPEQVLWDYIEKMRYGHPFLQWGASIGYSHLSLKENGPTSHKYDQYSKDREKYKKWFDDNPELMEDIFEYWKEDNKDVVEEFQKEFIVAFNHVAKRSFLPMIRDQ